MKTDTVEAWQIEADDWITLGGDAAFKVSEVLDAGESLFLILLNEDGEEEHFGFLAFEPVTLVTSFEDEDE